VVAVAVAVVSSDRAVSAHDRFREALREAALGNRRICDLPARRKT
jgi:hypothetical protein